MSIKVNILAKIDGDQIIRALRLPELKDADVGVSFEIGYDGATFTANTEEGAIDLLQCLAHPEKLNPARPSVETDDRQFKRGDINPMYCINCGASYERHIHTDEASLCPDFK